MGNFRLCRIHLTHIALVALTLMITLFCLSLIFWPSGVSSLGPTSDLSIVNAEVSPDGFARSAVLAGGVFPGPVIKGYKGDVFRINVSDHLKDDSMLKTTSVHWHGINLNGYNWADGVAFITQCPILPGSSFLYEFSSPGQVGTYWYHSHLSTQYCDGLRGPFIIYDPYDPYKDLYDVDDEKTIITLSDWYHLPAPSAGVAPTPNSTLINGLGRYKDGPDTPLAVVKVESGKRYRFRLIAMSCDPNYTFSIEGHMLTIIEADGEYTEPLLVDSIQIFAGQRYSFILNATMPTSNYWIRANPNVGNTGFHNGLNSAILRYTGAPGEEPTLSVNASSLKPLKDTDLHPLYNPQAPGLPTIDGVDVDLTLVLGFNSTTHKFTVNGESLQAPPIPVLLQILNGNTPPDDVLPTVYKLPPNKTIQTTIVVDGAPGTPHPWHLHGHTFSVVQGANSSDYNYENPVRRDTVSTGLDGESVTIRWRTDSSGPWVFHCHIDRHAEFGMGVIFIEDAEDTATRNSVSDEWKNLCPSYDNLTESDIGGKTLSTSGSSSLSSSTSSSSTSTSSATSTTSSSTSSAPLASISISLGDTLGLGLHVDGVPEPFTTSRVRRHRQRRNQGIEAGLF